MKHKLGLYCFFIILLGFLLFSSVKSVSAQDPDDVYTYRLIIPSSIDYCNCDDDCREVSDDIDGCLTRDSGSFLKSMNSLWEIYVEDAQENGYNGVCAELHFANQQTPYQMTKDCSLQFEPEPEEEPEEEEQEEEEPEEEEAAEKIIEAISGSTTIEKPSAEGSSNNQNGGGDTMEVSSAQLIALTVIVIGFFGLMGWIAYLLQK